MLQSRRAHNAKTNCRTCAHNAKINRGGNTHQVRFDSSSFARERGSRSDASRPTAASPPRHVCTHMAGTAAESADCKRVFTKCEDKSAEIFRNAKTKCRTSATNAKTNCRSCATNAKTNCRTFATNAKITRGGVAAQSDFMGGRKHRPERSNPWRSSAPPFGGTPLVVNAEGDNPHPYGMGQTLCRHRNGSKLAAPFGADDYKFPLAIRQRKHFATRRQARSMRAIPMATQS